MLPNPQYSLGLLLAASNDDGWQGLSTGTNRPATFKFDELSDEVTFLQPPQTYLDHLQAQLSDAYPEFLKEATLTFEFLRPLKGYQGHLPADDLKDLTRAFATYIQNEKSPLIEVFFAKKGSQCTWLFALAKDENNSIKILFNREILIKSSGLNLLIRQTLDLAELYRTSFFDQHKMIKIGELKYHPFNVEDLQARDQGLVDYILKRQNKSPDHIERIYISLQRTDLSSLRSDLKNAQMFNKIMEYWRNSNSGSLPLNSEVLYLEATTTIKTKSSSSVPIAVFINLLGDENEIYFPSTRLHREYSRSEITEQLLDQILLSAVNLRTLIARRP